MFDIGWQELFVIAVVALVVIGPKDLPRALRAISGVVRKARVLARDFQSGVDDLIRQADLEDIKKEIDPVRGLGIGGELDETRRLEQDVTDALRAVGEPGTPSRSSPPAAGAASASPTPPADATAATVPPPAPGGEDAAKPAAVGGPRD